MPPTPFRVLMVCTGNICRSVMAEAVLAEAAEEAGLPVEVDSAGISDEEEGNPIDPRAARVLRESGHEIPHHRARQLAPGELGSWDLVLTMTGWHYQEVERLARQAGVALATDPPIGAEGVTDLRMYRSFEGEDGAPGRPAGARRDLDVPDPWYGGHGDFVETLDTVEAVTPRLVDFLRTRLAEG